MIYGFNDLWSIQIAAERRARHRAFSEKNLDEKSSQDRRKIGENSNTNHWKNDWNIFKNQKHIQQIHYVRARPASKMVHFWRFLRFQSNPKLAPERTRKTHGK